ncbi:MAG: hypothetical protein HC769_24315 [Cyanobacteria bacterium CRU_2_1]|nr:hypothetical protein [Cyanobacteria bacterium CRU_2_1]
MTTRHPSGNRSTPDRLSYSDQNHSSSHLFSTPFNTPHSNFTDPPVLPRRTSYKLTLSIAN